MFLSIFSRGPFVVKIEGMTYLTKSELSRQGDKASCLFAFLGQSKAHGWLAIILTGECWDVPCALTSS